MIFKTLHALFDTYKKDHLILLGKRLKALHLAEDFNAYGQRKADIITTLVKVLASDPALQRLLQALTPAEYALLQENVYLRATEVFVSQAVFLAKYDHDYPTLSFDHDFRRRRTPEDLPSALLLLMSMEGHVPLEIRARLRRANLMLQPLRR